MPAHGPGADGAARQRPPPGAVLLRRHPHAQAAAHADRRRAVDAAALHDHGDAQEPGAHAHGAPSRQEQGVLQLLPEMKIVRRRCRVKHREARETKCFECGDEASRLLKICFHDPRIFSSLSQEREDSDSDSGSWRRAQPRAVSAIYGTSLERAPSTRHFLVAGDMLLSRQGTSSLIKSFLCGTTLLTV
ncbi:hypothetical protein FOCC_FOCC001355 [Frankliniella occidentalis]|nr:hypothetical protein FOCC_FOCC001355 [Frankliniella occidentalis]